MFMTHLICSLTGERYDADRLHNLSREGKPLLARYDLDAVAARLTREVVAGRPADMWKWRELLPLPVGAVPVSLGEIETPLIALDGIGRQAAFVLDDRRAAWRWR